MSFHSRFILIPNLFSKFKLDKNYGFYLKWLVKELKKVICVKKIIDFILSGWYLRRKNPIVSKKYIIQRMKHTLRVINAVLKLYIHLKISISLGESRKYMCTVYIWLCVPVCLITFTSTIYYIHVCAMIVNEYILNIYCAH